MLMELGVSNPEPFLELGAWPKISETLIEHWFQPNGCRETEKYNNFFSFFSRSFNRWAQRRAER